MPCFGSAIAVWLAGCASPAPPLPPSLKLPEIVHTLAAERVGDQVRLTWTTPGTTTDGLAIAGPVEAEICRTAGLAGAASAAARQPACPVAGRVKVAPGPSQWTDSLGALAAGAPGLLTYRVQLRNAAGRTAGPSDAGYAGSGDVPATVSLVSPTATRDGVVLVWAAAQPQQGEQVELRRTLLAGGVVRPVAPTGKAGRSLPVAASEPAEISLRVGGEGGAGTDPGGTIDRTALTGRTYRYTAQRVRTLAVGGQSVTWRSADSAAVTVEVRDMFPPDPPLRLAAVPGFVSGTPPHPSIDLVWEPSLSRRLAGYRVYRQDPAGTADWASLNDALLTAPAYRDTTVVSARRYAYRVTAVDAGGNESEASNEVTETAVSP